MPIHPHFPPQAGTTGLPSYTSASIGASHRPLFTSTVTVNIPSWLAGAAPLMAAAVGSASASAAHMVQVTATGTAQLTKRLAEQAAAAAALRTPELRGLMSSGAVRAYRFADLAAATA